MRVKLAGLVSALVATLVLAGCGDDDPAGGDGVDVVAGFYPLQYVAEQIGGDRVSVTNLAQPGAEPHDLELTPSQVAAVNDADVVAHLPGFQPALDEVVPSGSAFDAGSAVTPIDGEEGRDPHIWLDPTRLAAVGDALAARLAEEDPAGAEEYRTRAAALRQRLEALDQEYRAALTGCQRDEIVVSHAAFGYLANRYQLEQVAISGLSPEVEPTPGRLAVVAATAKASGATTIFFETLVSPKVAEAIAQEVGAATAVLDPIEGLEPGATGDYVSVMRENLTALTKALGCP